MDGQRTKTAYPNGVVIDHAYDQAQRLIRIHSHKPGAPTPTLQDLTYAYQDPTTSRQTPLVFEKTDAKLAHKHRYAYDGLDRLTSATIKSSSGDWQTNGTLARYGYTLDPAGNVTKRDVSGTQVPNSVTDFTYTTFNQMCAKQAGTATSTPPTTCPTSPAFATDKNGNQTTAPGRTATYNLLDQTTKLTISGSPTSMIYLGAGQDRWTTEGSGSFQHNVLGLGRRTVGTSTDSFTRDEGGKLVSRRNSTTRHYYLFDALGSVTGLTDATGEITERYDYEPYGTPAPRSVGQWANTDDAASFGDDADVPTSQFGFAAGYRSVGGLYHYGQRYYDPDSMRWTQPDPLEQTGDLREGDRYLYVGGDPINLIDPSGLHSRGTDGCSNVPDRGLGWDFHRACDGHDICYEAQRGRAFCDRGFHKAMVRTCGRFNGFCRNQADIYYYGVRAFGGPAYDAYS